MNPRILIVLVHATLSIGCVSHEGTYSPDCIAYEGNNISLDNGRFVWEKFTDQVLVDEDGKVVNQFPEYPKQGSYRIEGHTVYMQSDSGEMLETMYLHQRDNNYYLLTREQFEAFERAGRHADCPLMRGRKSGD